MEEPMGPIQFYASLFAGLAIPFMTAMGIRGCVNDLERATRPPVTISQYDINNDGLEDLVFSDKTVQIKQADGSYISLSEVESQEHKQVQTRYDESISENCREFNEAQKKYDSNLEKIEYRKVSETEQVRDKYTLKPKQIRNSVDNLDYNINTGKYVIGN